MVRKIAYQCLKDIVMNGAYSNLALKALPKNLSNKDKALITQLVYGTLQHYAFLSWQWEEMKQRHVKKSLEILINMSVYQLLFLDRIPHYAIVNEACELVVKQQRAFVQAILMQCIEQGRKEVELSDPLAKLHVESSIPQWVLELWKSHYGLEETLKIGEAMMIENHELIGRINPIKADVEALHQDPKLTFLDEWAFKSTENLIDTEYFRKGEIVIQDLASQQVAKLVAPLPKEKILDACSAPGTKSGMMAAMMNNEGEIVAADLHEHRLMLVQEGAKRLGIKNIVVKQMDASEADQHFEPESFDRMLLDVPCSGLGVLRRKPDLKFRIQPEDVDSLISLQQAILNHCSPLLKQGGVLVYSTCTLNRKENERQIQQFLKQHPEYELTYEKTFFPYQGPQDGFYMAKLVKNGISVIK